jgi:pyrroloquinoline quinone biosynthesis protein B
LLLGLAFVFACSNGNGNAGGDGARASPERAASDPAREAPVDRDTELPPIVDGQPFLVVLGVAQDGGVPQAGSEDHPGWDDPARQRRVVSLGLIDPRGGGARYLFEATPDFRQQLHSLSALLRADAVGPVLDGVFLTHGHVGHYTGLLFLGHEVIGARSVPVYAMPKMAEYLSTSGPWDQLVRYQNIELRTLRDRAAVELAEDLRVTPFLVPHRQEYTEVVGFRVDGPVRSALFVPDIDSFEAFDAWGTKIEDLIAEVDVAYLDGCFWAQGEIPGRDMSEFPHPRIAESLERFAGLAEPERAKIRFIHLNHTNPVLDPSGPERARVLAAGFGVAEEGERVGL